MALRFQTYFGVPIPPFKEEKIGAGSTTIRFVLTGPIISKKNNELAVSVKYKARSFLKEQFAKNGVITFEDAWNAVDMVEAKVVGNKHYAAFLEKLRPIISDQKQFWIDRLQKKGLMFPLPKSSIKVRLYIKDQYRRDTVNAHQTIQDLLKDCKVIVDDDDGHINPINAASARYYKELIYNIAFISLTFRL